MKGVLKSVQKSTGKLARHSVSGIEKTWDRLQDRRICLGVTGFSGSGKSTFLTSFIHQLIHFPQATLPAFSPALQERILGAELHFPENGESASFDYISGIKSLSSSPPQWPLPTSGLSSLVIEIRYKPKKRLLSIPGRRLNRLFVEIRDYPGEWLLDLPMLGMSFFDYLNRYRIRHAMDLLTKHHDHGDVILNIAFAVGFNSNSAFYAAFKKCVGQTPAQYRRSQLDKPH